MTLTLELLEEIETLKADNARLSALVQRAYNEGFGEGMREHTSSRGGKPWMDSAARTAMEASNENQ
jgi:hypothetical protein